MKGRDLERVAGIFRSYPRLGMCLDPELMQYSFSVVVWVFLVVVMATGNCPGTGGCVI